MTVLQRFDVYSRLLAAGIHCSITVCTAAVCAWLVFAMWYPSQYRLLAGGQELFILIIVVDVILGPLLTFAVFNLKKPRSELTRDLAIIVIIQLAALGYGVRTMLVARPVVVSYEVDRLKIVTYGEVQHHELSKALPEFQTLSLVGPQSVSIRKPRAGDETLDSVEMALKGIDVSLRPQFWVPFMGAADFAVQRARPLQTLLNQYPDKTTYIRQMLGERGITDTDVVFLPVAAKQANWTALLRKSDGSILEYLEVDGFF